MKSRVGISARSKWILTIIGIALGVYLCFRFILPLIFPFVIAYFLAWIIRPVTEFLYRRFRVSRMIGGTITLLILIAVVGSGLCLLIHTLLKQAVAFIKNIPVYIELITDKLDVICRDCDRLFGFTDGTARMFVDDNLKQTMIELKAKIMPGITERTISITIGMVGMIGILLIVLVATLLIVKDLPGFKKKYEKYEIYQDIHKVSSKLADAGIAYIRSQVIIMVIVAFLCVLGLTILRNEYALLLGVSIAIMDALPILGSGIVFIPWSIVMLLNGNIYAAAILITIYLLCQIVREVLEPKLIGNRIGIKPIFTLVSMYVGVKLFSIAGFFLGPIGLVIIITVVKVLAEKTEGNYMDPQSVTYTED